MSVVIDGTSGITSPAETVQGALTTTGNTILGDSSADTLNVGNGDLVKDASGNVGINIASPSTYGKFVVIGSPNADAGIFIGNASLTGSAPTYKGTVRIIDNPTSATGTSGGLEFLTSTFGSGYGWKMASIDSSGVNLTFSTRQNSASWTEAMRIDTAGLFQFNSGYGSVATAYGCRAWVNFNGTGTVAIRASGNVSSITDNGTGDYTVNFTTAMVDANYSLCGTAGVSVAGNVIWGICPQADIANFATGSIRFKVKEGSGSGPPDSSLISVSIFR